LGAAGPQEIVNFAGSYAALLPAKKKIVEGVPSTAPYRLAMRFQEIWLMDSPGGVGMWRGETTPRSLHLNQIYSWNVIATRPNWSRAPLLIGTGTLGSIRVPSTRV
jgi:hypothetical protein